MSMISEWMENGSLTLYLRQNPDVNRVDICMDVCAGLSYIHTNDMVHGDLKAANVMISSGGTAMVADFGNAQLKDFTLKFTDTTKPGLSVRWAAPELLLEDSGPHMSKEADVYAYGMTALEALTGKLPFEGITDNRVIVLVAHEQKTPPRPDIDICDHLWDVLRSCWTRESSQRPGISTVSEGLKALFPAYESHQREDFRGSSTGASTNTKCMMCEASRFRSTSPASSHSSRWIGSDEIGVAYTVDMPPPRTVRRIVTSISNASVRSCSEPQHSSLFEHPAEQDESLMLPGESTNGMIKRVMAQPSGTLCSQAATLGTELSILGSGTRYPDPSQSLLTISSSGGSFLPRLVIPTLSLLGSRSRLGQGASRTPSQFVTSSQAGSRTSRAPRGHSPTPSIPPSPPPKDTLTWAESPESEHDESAQLLTAEQGNGCGVGLSGSYGNSCNNSLAARTSQNSCPGWISPPTEEGFPGDADSEVGPSASDPPALESKPPTSHPGMARLVPREQPDSNAPQPVSFVSGNTVYHDAPSQPTIPRTPVSTWLGLLGRAIPDSGPAPPVPRRPSPLFTLTPVPFPSTSATPPLPVRTRGVSDSEVDPTSRLARDQAQPLSLTHSLAPPSPPSGPPSPPRTSNFRVLKGRWGEPPAGERLTHIRSTSDPSWDLRRFGRGRAAQVGSPHRATNPQVASVHGDETASLPRNLPVRVLPAHAAPKHTKSSRSSGIGSRLAAASQD